MSPYTFVAAWLIQSTVLGVVALLVPALGRIRQPAMLARWWSMSAMFVVLFPLLQALMPRRLPPPTPVTSFVDATTAAIQPALPVAAGASPIAWLLGLWGLGLLARLAWLRVGHRRLSTLADGGQLVGDDPALEAARVLAPSPRMPQLAAASVPVIEVAHAGPCAFGGLSPRILVPVALRDRPEEERLAVYLHELTHVARSDVGAALADEVWRAIVWWQPAVWWLLARLRLAREFEVDAAVVARTGALRSYVDALMWCSTLRPALSPSMQAGSRRHALVQRVALLCQGGEMSRRRQVITGVVMVVGFGGVGGAMAVISPLRAAEAPAAWSNLQIHDAGPLERSAVRPTLDAPAPRRTVAVEAVWSDPAVAYRFRAHVVIDAAGRVAEARLVGPPASTPVPDGVLPDLAAARDAALTAVRQWQFEAPPAAPMLLVVDVPVGDFARIAGLVDRTEQSLRTLPDGVAPLRVGGAVRPPKRVANAFPIYPEDAKAAGVTGVVIIEATVDTTGAVEDAHVIRSVPMLDAAAVDAVRQWRYEPTLVNGEPVPVIMTVTVNFTLAK